MKTYQEKMDALHISDDLKEQTVAAMVEAQRSERHVVTKSSLTLWRIVIPAVAAACALILAFVPRASDVTISPFIHWQDPRMTVIRTQVDISSEQESYYNALTVQTLNGKERIDFVFQPLTLADGSEAWFARADYSGGLRWTMSEFAEAFWSAAETFKPIEYAGFAVYFMQDGDCFYAFWQQAEAYQSIEGTNGTDVQQAAQDAIGLLSK